MALDGMFLHHIAEELNICLKDGRVSQIYQPNRDEITMAFRTYNGTKKLLISTRANSPRINLTEEMPENPATPTMLCMLMRKRLSGAKLINIHQPQLERIIMFDFESVNELGDKVKLTLAVEIMGKYSNVILFDENNIITDALKRVDLSMSTQRLILPNMKYELPPKQDKLCILSTTPDKIISQCENFEREVSLNKALLSAIQGISPIICRELEYKVANGVELTNKNLSNDKKMALYSLIEKLSDKVASCSGQPYLLVRKADNKLLDFTFLPINQYGDTVEQRPFESFSTLLDSFYTGRDKAERMKVKSQSLTKLINNLIERISKKLNIQKSELEKCKDRERLRICGDILQANLYRLKRGDSVLKAENFYDENNSIIEIKLNSAISPAANAQKYYKDYAKAKTAEKMLTSQLEKGFNELQYLETVSDSLNRAESEKDLSQIRLELTEQGYLKSGKGRQKSPKPLPPMEFTSSDGFKILVGRNNKQNDQLTLKTARKTDIWFHTKNIPGSHTIVITEGKDVPQNTILEAAQLAAYHSKAQNSESVPVDYTIVKNVNKPNGAKPGMVIYLTNETVYVTPKVLSNKEQ